jgi:hypothetical protein
MIRTQIQLTEAQARKLRAKARAERLSLAETIRRFVDKGLESEKCDRTVLYGRAAGVIGRFPDRKGARDLAARHDDYLDDAFD